MIASEPIADAVLCFRNSGWSSETFKSDVIHLLGELHADPAGQQILTLFSLR